MTDRAELKRLAEAFPADLDWDSNTEPFFNGPSGESLGGGATGFYCVYGKPFRLEGEDYDYDGPTYVEACPVDFAKFMVAAREGVLALIAENERLTTQVRLAGVSAEVTVHQEVGRAITEALTVTIERDELRAEIAALKTGYEAYERVNAELKAECEALREEIGGIKEVSSVQVKALKALTFAARTTGGTAGHDEGLMKACEEAERSISLGGIGRAYMAGADAAMGQGERS